MLVTELLERVKAALAERYAVERVLGRGGMATVYLARDIKHDRPVAIKVFRPDIAAAIGSDRFLLEISIIARLQHPHILPLHDSGTADGLLYYVMPYVDGEALSTRLEREKRLSIDEALAITAEVSSALDYAHRQGVVHRDVKPANILLSEGHAMVADFGVARAVSAAADTRITIEGVAVGTPAYMSPEQASGDPEEVDSRSDIYSLGCVLYEMLTGEPPYEGSTLQSIYAKLATGEAPAIRHRRPDVPKSVDSAVSKALAKSPSDRFDSGAALTAALRGEVRIRRSVKRQLRRWAVAMPVIVAMIGIAMWLIPPGFGGDVTSDARVIAVIPFTASGPNVELLSEGMVDLLSTNLDEVGGIRTVDPRTVLHHWRERATGGTLDLNGALAIGRDLRAGSVILGSIVEAGPEVRLTAELRAVDGERLAQASAEGQADSVFALVDSLSIRLLREVWRSRQPIPDLQVSAITTGSLAAIRAYLRGEQYYRRSQWDSAATEFGSAIAADPTFALALLRMGQTVSWVFGHGSQQAVRLSEAAAAFGTRLPPRERTFVLANRLLEAGRLEALDTLRSYVIRYPDDAEAWYQLGTVQYRARFLVAAGPAELYNPFDRVLEIDPSLTPALIDPIELSISERDSVRFHRYYQLLEQTSLAPEIAQFELAHRVLWSGPDSAAATLQAAGDGSGQLDEAFDVLRILLDGARASHDTTFAALLPTVDAILGRTPQTDARYVDLLTTKVRLLHALGRLAEARELSGRLAEINPSRAWQASLMPVLSGIVPQGSTLLLDPPRGEPILEADQIARDYWLALDGLARGDLSGASRIAERGLARDLGNEVAPYRGLFQGIVGWIDIVRGDTAGGTVRLTDGLNEAGYLPWVTDLAAPLRFQLARTLASSDLTRSEGIQRLRRGIAPHDREFIPMALLALGRALDASGDATGAARAYAELRRWWQDAEPELRAFVPQEPQRPLQ